MTTHPTIPPDADPGPVPAAEIEHDWIFTFGAGHRAFAFGRGRSGDGFPLTDRYVVIRGTAETSRAQMFSIFGACWSHQYPSAAEAGIDEYELTQLVLTTGSEVKW
jgi:hypothetical protein